MRRSLEASLRAIARVLRGLGARAELLAARVAGEDALERRQAAVLRGAMTAHDMAADPDELYYRDRYLEVIEPALAGADRSGAFLDAGCGPGRLLVPLARAVEEYGGRVVGVDFVPECVTAAEREIASAGLANAAVEQGDLLEWLRQQEDSAFAGAIFLETAYVLTDVESAVTELARVIAPGGFLVTSLRTRVFLMQLAVANRDWPLADAVAKGGKGMLPGMGWQNWHDERSARALLEGAGFENLSFTGIGTASGLPGDPLERLERPSLLSDGERRRLALIESSLPAEGGRYLVVAASRSAAR